MKIDKWFTGFVGSLFLILFGILIFLLADQFILPPIYHKLFGVVLVIIGILLFIRRILIGKNN